MRKYEPLFATIINCVSIITFAVLAIHFDKWWIVLFSALFLFTAKSEKEEEK